MLPVHLPLWPVECMLYPDEKRDFFSEAETDGVWCAFSSTVVLDRPRFFFNARIAFPYTLRSSPFLDGCVLVAVWLGLQAEEAHRKEEEETRRRLSKETSAWQKQVLASARKEAQERDEIAKREAREKVETREASSHGETN